MNAVNRSRLSCLIFLLAALIAVTVGPANAAENGRPVQGSRPGVEPIDPELQEKLDGLEQFRDWPTPPRTETSGELSVGPDVTIIDLWDVENYTSGGGTTCPAGYGDGVGPPDECRGYCGGHGQLQHRQRAGGLVRQRPTAPAAARRRTTYHAHVATETDHSVISQNLYRLKDGRFQQIGLGFLKHGFVSTNSSDSGCVWNDNGTPNTSPASREPCRRGATSSASAAPISTGRASTAAGPMGLGGRTSTRRSATIRRDGAGGETVNDATTTSGSSFARRTSTRPRTRAPSTGWRACTPCGTTPGPATPSTTPRTARSTLADCRP